MCELNKTNTYRINKCLEHNKCSINVIITMSYSHTSLLLHLTIGGWTHRRE